MSGTSTLSTVKNISAPHGLNFYARIIDMVFRPLRRGRLSISLPNGTTLQYGEGNGTSASIQVRNNDFFRKCVLFGDIGFGESYVDGDWTTDNLTAVIEFMIENYEHHPTLMNTKRPLAPVNFLKMANDLLSIVRRNTRQGSKANIAAHYDLSNEFYQLFLDPTMTYSAAYFKDDTQPLQDAQLQKYEELCRKVRLKKTDHLLEIGSGWGGFSIYAAQNFGCRVTTVTVSRRQYEYAVHRIAEEGLTNQIDIQLKDYRDLTGQYDKIVSIEMIEAVGHQFYDTYFRQCHTLLKKDGLLALQMITSPDHRFDSFRKNIDFIQKHIFPGSLLPSLAAIMKSINKTGDLNLFDYEDMTGHYATTLRLWNDRFNSELDRVRRLGFDDTFIRKWNYYLSYCEAAFKTRNIGVVQAVFARPNGAIG